MSSPVLPSTPATVVSEILVSVLFRVNSLLSAISIPSAPSAETKAIPPVAVSTVLVPVNWKASAPPSLLTVKAPPIL